MQYCTLRMKSLDVQKKLLVVCPSDSENYFSPLFAGNSELEVRNGCKKTDEQLITLMVERMTVHTKSSKRTQEKKVKFTKQVSFKIEQLLHGVNFLSIPDY